MAITWQHTGSVMIVLSVHQKIEILKTVKALGKRIKVNKNLLEDRNIICVKKGTKTKFWELRDDGTVELRIRNMRGLWATIVTHVDNVTCPALEATERMMQ